MSSNIDDLTIGQLKQIQSIGLGSSNNDGLDSMIGKHVIIRTYSAGAWFGQLAQKSGKEVVISSARRMYRWWAKESISLSACAIHGIKWDKSKIVEPVDSIWLEAIEIIPCTDVATQSFADAPNVKAE